MRTTKNFRVLHAIESAKASPRKSPRPVLTESFSQAVSKFQVPSTATKQPDSSAKRAENSTSPLRYYPQRSQNAANLAKLNIFCAPYFQDEISTTNRSELNRGNQTHHKSQSESDISPITSFRSRLGLPEKSQESLNVSPVYSLRRLNNSQTPTSHLKAFEKQIKRSNVLSQSPSREKPLTKKRDTFLSTISNESAESSASKKLMNLPLHLIPSPAHKKLVRPVIIPRVTKVDKILDEIRQNSGLHNINNNKTSELSSTKDNTPFKTESNADDISPYGFFAKRIVTEGDNNDPLKFHEISQKLTDYRILFKTQMHDLEKVRTPFIQKREIVSRQQRMSIVKRTIPPQQKKKIKTKLAKKILNVLKKMSLLNLTMDEIIQHKVFPSIPYEHAGSRDLFDYVKSGDILKVTKTLKQNKYFVYDFDHARETCLHWAAKRNFAAIVKLLLEKGADPNAIDLTGRTPLFLAAKGEFKICVKLLLFYGADPTLRSQNNKLAKDYTKDPETHDLLEKAYLIHEKLSPLKIKDFKKKWDLLDKTAFRVKMLGVGGK